METAMDWVQRLSEDNNPSEKEVTDWLAWYESDAGNAQAFDRLHCFWEQLGEGGHGDDFHARLAAIEREDVQSADVAESPLAGSAAPPHRWFPGRRTGLFGLVAAAAASVIGGGLVLSLYHASPPTPNIAATGAEESSAQPPVRHTQLPDGSSVDLAARTSLAVQYTPLQRTLVLANGEAYFSVAPSRSRPFVVKTSAVRVRAVGTKFDVRQEPDRVVVTVVQGVVEVSPAADEPQSAGRRGSAQPIRLSAGNEVTWFVGRDERIVSATTPERALAWRDGRLDYVNDSLDTVIADVNRYSNTRVVIRDVGVGQMTYTGTIFIHSIDEWLQAMPSEFPIAVVREKSEIVIEPRATPGSAAAKKRE
jgi:transmembrane sensor